MSDSVLDRLKPRKPGDSLLQFYQAGAEPTEAETTEDFGCFGWLRGVRERAVMLELRKKDGSILAIAYAYIERIEFDPTNGIAIHANGRTIRIKGRHLNGEARPTVRLFEGLTRHRVPWVGEAGHEEIGQRQDATPVVDAIEI